VSTQPKLLDRVRDRLRYKQYSLRTEQAYVHWIKRFIFFHGKRHPEQMNGPEVEAFLTHLAKQERVAAATQDQALSALLFLYKEVLQKELPWLDGVERPKRPARLPVVLTENEVRALLARLEGTRWPLVSLLYGTGMRLLECLRLRVKDVDFEMRQITIREGKGGRDRVTMLPERLSMFSPPASFRPILYPASCAGITWTRKACSAPSRSPREEPGSENPFRLTYCGTASPLICCRLATISARFRNCSGTRT